MGAKIQADEISSIIKERIDNFEYNVEGTPDMLVAERLKTLIKDRDHQDSAKMFFSEVVNTEVGKEYLFRLHIVDKTSNIQCIIYSLDENDNALDILGTSTDPDLLFTAKTIKTRVIMVVWYNQVDKEKIGIDVVCNKLSKLEKERPIFITAAELTEVEKEKALQSKFLNYIGDYDGDKKDYKIKAPRIHKEAMIYKQSGKSKKDRRKDKIAKDSRKKNR